ncbi:MAG: phosphate ABC transporter permease subunit PstC [Desulfopila sp.]
MYSYFLAIVLIAASAAYFMGTDRARKMAAFHGTKNHSLAGYYGLYTAIWAALPALLLYGVWQAAESSVITSMVAQSLPAEFQKLSFAKMSLVVNDMRNIISGNFSTGINEAWLQNAADKYIQLRDNFRLAFIGLALLTIAGCTIHAYKKITPRLEARNIVERLVKYFLIACSAIAILTTLGILLSVLFEAIRFFKMVDITEFLFGLKWSPQMALRADQAGSSGAFGAIPVFAGTFLIAGIAMLVAIPIGLMSAIYLSEFAAQNVRTVAKPLLEILAGIPTVVYGFFAALIIAPMIRDSGALIGLDVASESALAAGGVMGIMIIPFISSLSDDVIHAVPQSLRDGSYALGATQFETIRSVIVPAALPGIVGSVLLAVSRAIGETMIVVMAAGLSANLTANPFQAVTTVTVQIVTLLVGDQEFDSPKTLAAFALGLLLFLFTLVLNFIALHVVRRYREQYE